jgi:hypothetical protein
MASVIQDSNVYDAPGGKGKRVGGNNFFLHADTQVQLVEPCSNDWCHVVLPTPPGGQAWAYQPGFLKAPQ